MHRGAGFAPAPGPGFSAAAEHLCPAQHADDGVNNARIPMQRVDVTHVVCLDGYHVASTCGSCQGTRYDEGGGGGGVGRCAFWSSFVVQVVQKTVST